MTQQSNGAADEVALGCRDMAMKARSASRKLQTLSTQEREAMLQRVADAILAAQPQIMAENQADVQAAQGQISDVMLQRLALKPAKLEQLAQGIKSIAAQEEPIGRLLQRMEISEGMVLDKVTAPIGVLLVIFEARPDALPQIASLALRSGNGLLLKGGKEAARSNAILHRTIVDAVGPIGRDLIGLVTTREEINDLLVLDDVIDLVIPRGSNSLVSFIKRNTKIPVLGHADGICHVYVDAAADLEMAKKVVLDSKVDYPAACNAVEKVLVHSSWLSKPGSAAASGVRSIVEALQSAGVKVFGGARASAELQLPRTPHDRHEYSCKELALELVDDMEQAIDHIHTYGSGHTESIVTADKAAAEAFLAKVDAACVFHNTSTRFSDGFRFGLGAEVGISTSRIHARGPVGVEGLMTSKWLMRGSGQLVEKDAHIKYTHKMLPI